MANTKNSDQWYFTKEQLESTPSRQCGFDAMKELQYRQQAANFIQDMGQRLKVSQLCINTAIVYMHRFYVFHSFSHFPWHQMAAAALFLAAKVEEQPRKLEYVIRVANICRNPRDTNIDINSERYIAQSQDLVFNENVLLQTLGFDVAIDHPHTHVVRCCHLVRASKDLAQTSYFMASNSLHLTTMCLQYKPTVVACFCILLACKWSNWKIPLSVEDKEWYCYVDSSVTAELLDQLTKEFLEIFENCPSRLKEKIMALSDNQAHTPSHSSSQSNSPFDQDPKKIESTPHKSLQDLKGDHHKHRRPHDGSSSHHSSREERREREKMMMMAGKSIPSSRPAGDPKMKSSSHSGHPAHSSHQRPSAVGSGGGSYPQTSREPRDILREAAKEAPFGLANVRDVAHARPDKPKPNSAASSDPNYADVRLNYDKSKMDARARVDPGSGNKGSVAKQQEHRNNKFDDQNSAQKHPSNAVAHAGKYNNNNSGGGLVKSTTMVKSPMGGEGGTKSVPGRSNAEQLRSSSSYHSSNNGDSAGSSGGGYGRSGGDGDVRVKQENVTIKEEFPPTQPVVVKRSLFSPDSTPPHQKICDIKKEPLSESSLSAALSPMKSPSYNHHGGGSATKTRTYSSSSTEAELRPTMKKIDQVEGFENLMRDNTIGMNNVPTPEKVKKELISPTKSDIKREYPETTTSSNPCSVDSGLGLSQSSIVNGLETNPTLISNLLKEAPPTVSHLPSGVVNSGLAASINDQSGSGSMVHHEKDKEHHHHKSKKKKEKHKHKDKDKHKEEKEKKRKHKDKDKEKYKHKERKGESQAVEASPVAPSLSEPIKIKIQKDKIHPMPDAAAGLKIKIPKDRIVDSLPQPSSGGLKIKIPKEMITNCKQSGGTGGSLDVSVSSSSSGGRKRDRSSPGDLSPPHKVSRSSHGSSKHQNGRHSYPKVALGEGEASGHRLAESKYAKQHQSSSTT